MKVLVISDNKILYEGIKRIFDSYDFENVDFVHSHLESELWYHKDFVDKKRAINVRENLDELIKNYNLIISAHCKQFFPKELVKSVRCINVHPGFNPINRGWFPQVFAIIHNLPIGATIHEMDEKLDHGPIIARELVVKYEEDTSLTIYNRVVELELELFRRNFKNIITGKYKTIIPEKNESNYFDKKDFNDLCEIDLDEILSFKNAINRLRALTHGDFENAYFYNNEGEKIYVSIQLRKGNE